MRFLGVALILAIVSLWLVSDRAVPIGPRIVPATASAAPVRDSPTTVSPNRRAPSTARALDNRDKHTLLGLVLLLAGQQARHGR